MSADDSSHGDDQPTLADGLSRLKRFTPARIALARAGTAQTTATSLNFMLDHARARDAVHATLDFLALGEALHARDWSVLRVHSAAGDRAEYLRRPDLGRRLSPVTQPLVANQMRGSDVAIVAADGLSALAITTNLLPVLDCLRPLLLARRRTIGPLVLVEQGRVAIGDEIAHALGAEFAVVMIGERPGLSAADSVGLYLTLRPQPGVTRDAGRNCISNIRPGGLALDEAAHRLAWLIGAARRLGATGVALKEDAPEALPPPT